MADLPDDPNRLGWALDAAIKAQRDYEKKRGTRLGAGAERVLAPAARLLRRVVPPAALRQALEYADRGAGYSLPRELTGHDPRDLAACEAAALRAQAWAAGTSAATGGLSGFFGGFGATLDIPATITLAARNVRATGLAFGFDGSGEEERLFRLALLELAVAQGFEARSSALGRVNGIARELSEPEVRLILDKASDWVIEKVVDRVGRQLGVDLLARKAGQVVPIAGGIIGGAVNASFQTDVARAARYGYRQRWLMHRQLLPAPA